MNKTIKIIDLLNKIVKREVVPQKIKDRDNGIWIWDEDRKIYNLEDVPFIIFNADLNKLNDELEIIEDKEEIDIQSIEEITCNDNREIAVRLKSKINELINAVKQLDKEIKEMINNG